jgi:hypothetical protein
MSWSSPENYIELTAFWWIFGHPASGRLQGDFPAKSMLSYQWNAGGNTKGETP